MKNLRRSEVAVLEQYQIAIQNVKNQPIISQEMAELGYDASKIKQGQMLLEETREAYDFNKQENNETVQASAIFKREKEELEVLYKKHRKKAKVVLRKTPEVLKKLGINGSIPAAYINKIETIRTFYKDMDADILQKLAVLKIDQEDITAGNLQLQKVETARAEYLKEVGESQDATKQKDTAFAKMDDWMRDFYAVADIALEDQPQLMEALGRKRKS